MNGTYQKVLIPCVKNVTKKKSNTNDNGPFLIIRKSTKTQYGTATIKYAGKILFALLVKKCKAFESFSNEK